MQDPTRESSESALVGEKIRKLRRHRRVSIVEFAKEIGIRKETISRVENGKDKLSTKQKKAIKAYFDIEGMPLSDSECKVNNARHNRWRALLRAGRMEEAKAIWEERASIVNLEPCDPDAVTQYKLLEAQMFAVEGKYDIAEEKLALLQTRLDVMSFEHLYYYNFLKGYLLLCHERHKDALEFLHMAHGLANHVNLLPVDVGRLYFDLALCYTRLGIPYRAIHFCLKCKLSYVDDVLRNYGLSIDSMLVRNYIKVNELDEAEKLLKTCHIKAESAGNSPYLGYIMLCYGLMHVKTESWTSALECLEQAIEDVEKGTAHYYSVCYYKIYCIIGARMFSNARRELEKVKAICGADKVWAIYFESLGHHITISSRMSRLNNESIDYIQTVTIPHLMETHDYFIAIDYCKLLKQHYKQSRSIEKSFQMSEQIANIYEHCLLNNDIEVIKS